MTFQYFTLSINYTPPKHKIVVASEKSPESCVFWKNSYHRIWRKLFLWKGFPEMDANWLQCIVCSVLLYRGLHLSNFVLCKHKSWSWLNCFTFMNECFYFSPQYQQFCQYSCDNHLFVYICSLMWRVYAHRVLHKTGS